MAFLRHAPIHGPTRLGALGAAALVCALLVALAPRGSAASEVGEYEIKAAFLYNFALYVEWPKDGAPDAGTFVIGVLGEDPFGPILDRIAHNKTVNGKKIVIKRFDTIEDYTPCHILFIAASEADRLAAILKTLNDAPVLTVGDTTGFGQEGVIINLYVEQGKVRFKINLAAAQRVGLTISSKLLRLATIVKTTEERDTDAPVSRSAD